jgi:hypothetical protein
VVVVVMSLLLLLLLSSVKLYCHIFYHFVFYLAMLLYVKQERQRPRMRALIYVKDILVEKS